MKQAPDLDKAQREMRPGAITRDGFLGDDNRKLLDILLADDAAVANMGLTHAAIAGRMTELRDAGLKGLGNTVPVEDRFEVLVEGVRGRLACPFGDAGLVPKVNTTVKNTATGEQLIFTDLNIHLIEHHGFYEGRGAAFRLDPVSLASVIGCSAQ
jgi:hypothetical protein